MQTPPPATLNNVRRIMSWLAAEVMNFQQRRIWVEIDNPALLDSDLAISGMQIKRNKTRDKRPTLNRYLETVLWSDIRGINCQKRWESYILTSFKCVPVIYSREQYYRSWYWLRARRQKGWSSNPGMGKTVSSPGGPDRLWVHPSLLASVYRKLFLTSNEAGALSFPLPTPADVRNTRI
jgi:hypothetical protein